YGWEVGTATTSPSAVLKQFGSEMLMMLKSLRSSSLRMLYCAVIFFPRFAWMLFSLLLILLSDHCLQHSLVHWASPVVSPMWAAARRACLRASRAVRGSMAVLGAPRASFLAPAS
ncbi:hypothetical protein MPH_13311, partial [Macrophomina phaseolina MS6]